MSDIKRETTASRWVCAACWTEGLGDLPRACPTCGSGRLWASSNFPQDGQSMQDHFYDRLGEWVGKHGFWMGEALGTGFRRDAPEPRTASAAETVAVDERCDKAILLLTHGGEPTSAELASAPLLDAWYLTIDPANRLRAAGRVLLGSGQCTPLIITTPLILIDSRLAWLRTLTTVYTLGCRRSTILSSDAFAGMIDDRLSAEGLHQHCSL